MAYSDIPGLRNVAGAQINPATAENQALRDNAAATLINLLHLTTEKTKVEDNIGGHRYHGRALLATADATASWEVYRFARDAAGNVIGPNSYQTGISWTNRASGWPS